MRVRYIFLTVSSFIIISPLFSTVAAQAPLAYYIDCINGLDTNTGTSASSAWKTLTKANSAPLKPGDKLLLKRGCTWTPPLLLKWTGTEASPILISDYGTGSLPKIENSSSSHVNEIVQITGEYQILENVEVTTNPTSYTRTFLNPADGGCNRYLDWRIGIRIGDSQNMGITAKNNIVRNSVVTGHATGILFRNNSLNNSVVYNEFFDNRALRTVETDGTNAIGSMHIDIHGEGNEIGHNTFRSTDNAETGFCTTTENTVELYAASGSYIHHNRSFGDRVFSEMGSNPDSTPPNISSNNTYAYNLHVSGVDAEPATAEIGARFIVTRGEGHKNGPVVNTLVYNNTVYYPGRDGQGISCQLCSSAVLTMKNNIFAVQYKGIFVGPDNTSASQPVESHNIYWDTDCPPGATNCNFNSNFLQNLLMSPTSKRADPLFVSPSTNPTSLDGFQLMATSPAINTGTNILGTDFDIVGTPIYQGAAPDIGALEFTTQSASPTPTTIPGDIVANCQVDLTDLSALLGSFGKTDQSREVNDTPPITLADLSILLSNFGKRCS